MIRIRGIVKAAQTAQNSLKVGILPHDVPAFKTFVTGSIETIERLCAEAQTSPEQLPSSSRSAYYFLKGIDLENLPLTASQVSPQIQHSIGLKNIKTQQRTILQRISHLASNPTPNAVLVEQLAQRLQREVAAIERICSNSQATPANLTSSSRFIYTWMKYLTDLSHLQLHLQTTQRVQQLAVEICSRHASNLENIVVELTYLSGLYKVKCSGKAVTLTISEGFINASDEVLRALVTSACLGKAQNNTCLLKQFASSEEYSDVLLELDLITEVIAENSKGKCYDLDELFHKVNREYFASSIVKPRLIWSQMHTYRKFGHYEPARDRVMISLSLDQSGVPDFVVEFVLYHELLHKYHGVKSINGRRMLHTPEFRTSERQFKLYKEAEAWLKRLAAGSGCSDLG